MTDFLDWTGLAGDVDEMLGEFQAVTLNRPSTSAPTYDPSTGISTPVAPASYVGRGAVFDYKQTDVNQSLVEAGDQRLLLSPLCTDGTPMPEPMTSDDVVLANGKSYTVQRGGEVAPAGVVCLYDIQLRGVG